MSKLVSLLEKGKLPWEKYAVQWTTADGAYSVVEVETQWDYGLEGYLLAHCIGTKNIDEFGKAHRVLSLRDRLGYSHATILLQRVGVHSPYGGSRDLLSDAVMRLDEKGSKFPVAYYVLQVRGREDRIARWEYYAIVREWYQAHGGKFSIKQDAKDIRRAVKRIQDRDIKYHYGYLLDESANWFDWAYWHETRADRLAELGLVNL